MSAFPHLNLAGVAYGTSSLDWSSVPPTSVHNPNASTLLIGPSPSGSDFLSLKHEPMGFKVRTTVELVKVGPTMDCEGGLKVKMEGGEEATIGLGFVMNEPVVVTSVGGDTSYHYCLEDKQSVVAVKKSAVDEKKAGGVGSGVGLTFTAISNERGKAF